MAKGEEDLRGIQCTAKSKQSKKQCGRKAIPGGRVCYVHGGAAPQVQQRAKERLAALVEPAIERLGTLLRQKKSDQVALGAVKDVLDRNGFKPTTKVDPDGEGGIVISWESTA